MEEDEYGVGDEYSGCDFDVDGVGVPAVAVGFG